MPPHYIFHPHTLHPIQHFTNPHITLNPTFTYHNSLHTLLYPLQPIPHLPLNAYTLNYMPI